jgi:tetratricopeptide (TPR) repeat protein
MDGSLAEPHTALAFALLNYDWDWGGAAQEYQRALELNPNYSEAHHSYAELLMASGKNNEAVAEIRRAEELDPLLPALRANVGMVCSCAGRHDEAIEQLRNTTELNPDYDFGYSALVVWHFAIKSGVGFSECDWGPLRRILDFRELEARLGMCARGDRAR